MRILSYLLLDGPSSPMYKALIDSHIGSEYAPATGYDSSTKIATFSCGLQGMKYEDVGKVEKIILQVFEDALRDNSWMDRVDAAIHLIELGQKHKTGRFGLGLAQSLVPSWIRGCDPFENMQINDVRSVMRMYTILYLIIRLHLYS